MSIAAYSNSERSIAVIGFDTTDLRDIEQAAAQAGARLLSVDPGTAAFADVTLIDAETGARSAEGGAHHGQIVVRTSLSQLDDVLIGYPDAEIVVGRDPIDLHLALAGALKRAATGVSATFDVASDEGLRLQRLADEIARIARTLVDLPDGLNGSGARARTPEADAVYPNGSSPDTPATAEEVRAIIRLRRMRDRFFPADLFADPAWDMLLDLAAARIERVRVAVSSLCIAAAVPPTTALRWIKAMTDKGLLRRVADPHDARRIFIQLSDDAAAAMEKYLRAARGAGQAI